MSLPRRRGTFMRMVLMAVCLGMAGLVSPAISLADTDLTIGGEAVVAYAQGDDVRIRSGASYGDSVISSVPEGSTVSVNDGPFADGEGNAWYAISVNGVSGYMVSDYLAAGTTAVSMTSNGSATATATDTVNLRRGPSLGYAVIGEIAAGDIVTVNGSGGDGWLQVTWNGFEGWAHGDFFSDGGSSSGPGEDPVVEEEPVAEEPPIEWIEAGTRYTVDSVNFRSGPSLDSTVHEVLPAGVAVELTGKSQSGFAEGTANGYGGWVSLDYLSWEAPAPPEPGPEPETDENLSVEAETAEQEAEQVPAPGGSSIVWPVSGSEWYVSQGYNGSSHVNSGSLWQYRYSFDLKRSDGNTAGQPVYAPVSGTVRWLDPDTGGITIDIGNGLAFAMFHADVDGSITEGQAISQGDYVGTISYPGYGGNGGSPHLHITAWATSDGGNWDRQAIPFEGAAAISGQSFPSNGVSQDWTGTVIYP